MEECRSLITRFPKRELDIRRRCANDAHFSAVCQDYEEAAAALRYWQNVSSDHAARVEEYRNFIVELEAEILAQLETARAPQGT